MFNQLSESLNNLFSKFGKGKLTEESISEGVREVRLALLEADVNHAVVGEFIKNVTAKAIGDKLIKAVRPSQQFIKIVHDELISTMGGEGSSVKLKKGAVNILMTGLQGSGKTTTAAKIAYKYKKNYRFLLVSADTYRPAAMEQLKVMAEKAGVDFFEQSFKIKKAVDIVKKAKNYAEMHGYNGIIVDTAGRTEVDDEMMRELTKMSKVMKFNETYFVADSTAGQAIADTVKVFHEKLNLSGLILTKFDSDTRGGAALSVKSVTGKPISFMGTGEKLEDLDLFYPERIASRILGKGDVLTLIENAQNVIHEDEVKKLEKRLKKNQFTLADFRDQMLKMKKMGSLSKIVEMIPGAGSIDKSKLDDGEITRVVAIIDSMTAFERRNSLIINGNRKKRVAKGSGTTVRDVNQLLSKFNDMKKMMRKMSKNPAILDKFQVGDMQGMDSLF